VRESLRSLLARPIGSGDRRRLAIASIGLLATVVLAMQFLRSDVTKAPPAPVAAAGPEITAPTPAPDPATPPAEGEEADPPPRAVLDEAKRFARRFLDGYLRFSLGRAGAASIPHASDELRAALAAQAPREPETLRGRRVPVAIELVQVETATAARVELLTMARAGAGRLSLELQLARSASGWVVVGVER
jgi:hypothetical protein